MGAFKVRSSPSQHLKPATTAGFRFLEPKCVQNCVQTPMKYLDYKPPKLRKGKRWYIEFWYRVPPELVPVLGKEWERFRVNEGINRYKDQQLADQLLKAVEEGLKAGKNPFKQAVTDLAMEGTGTKELTIKEGLEFFLKKYQSRGLESTTLNRYSYAVELVREYFAERKLLSQPISKVRKIHIENLLEINQKERKWSNRQYNNLKGYIFTIFEFLRKKEQIDKNPVEHIESLKSKSKRHRYYDKQLFPKVTAVIKDNSPYLWYAVQFVYYLCVRSEKELSQIKVGDILDNGERFLFRAESTKSDRDDLIPIDPNLRKVMAEMGLFKAPKNYYIFTTEGKPGPVPFGKNFFARRFREIRELAGLSTEFTLYGFRATRAVHLINDGLKPVDLMVLLRHTNFQATQSYLRGLGIDFDKTDLIKKGRKI